MDEASSPSGADTPLAATLRAPALARLLAYQDQAPTARLLAERAVGWTAGPRGGRLVWSDLVRHLLPQVDDLLVGGVPRAEVAAAITACVAASEPPEGRAGLGRRGGGRDRLGRQRALSVGGLKVILCRIRREWGGAGPETRAAIRDADLKEHGRAARSCWASDRDVILRGLAARPSPARRAAAAKVDPIEVRPSMATPRQSIRPSTPSPQGWSGPSPASRPRAPPPKQAAPGASTETTSRAAERDDPTPDAFHDPNH